MNKCVDFEVIGKPYTYQRIKIEPPFPDKISERTRFGIDPGTTKMGLAWIWKNFGFIYEVKIVRDNNPVNRILITQDILSHCFSIFAYAPLMVIEGSSFGNNYRQVELAEVRASTVLWAIKHGITPMIVPPSSIRKQVFGSAKIKAEDTWKDYPPDAASALACAYYMKEK